ncbi:hypothetical protein [Polaromonas sp.]|uniref:hypothetical protein n=1 Tax=Polaromonas sp. TaxID=1869339 RepID=UPI00352B73C7
MFGGLDKSKGFLFCTHDLGQILGNLTNAARKEIEDLNADRFLNTVPADLKNYLIKKYSIASIVLRRHEWYAETKDIKVDVRYDPLRWIDDKSRPCLVPGEQVVVHIPFAGDPELLYSRASTFSMNPPRADVDGNEIVLKFESPADQPRDVRPMVDQTLAVIEEHLKWQDPMISGHNASLDVDIETAVRNRRARLLAQSQRAEALGIPIKKRDDAPATYTVPLVRRKVLPTLPPASTSQFKPEPVWEMEQYEQALKIVQDMALVMERSPQAFKSMDEEALRQHFLVQLNGQFEGKATGETFNMAGKTDILLREGDRNVFIAECKFWKGPKAFGDAIDQLMSYATWRDGKAALLVFNRGTDTSTVLEGIDRTAKLHLQFKRAVNWPHESGFRYIFSSIGDRNRELILTTLVFHVPS